MYLRFLNSVARKFESLKLEREKIDLHVRVVSASSGNFMSLIQVFQETDDVDASKTTRYTKV